MKEFIQSDKQRPRRAGRAWRQAERRSRRTAEGGCPVRSGNGKRPWRYGEIRRRAGRFARLGGARGTARHADVGARRPQDCQRRADGWWDGRRRCLGMEILPEVVRSQRRGPTGATRRTGPVSPARTERLARELQQTPPPAVSADQTALLLLEAMVFAAVPTDTSTTRNGPISIMPWNRCSRAGIWRRFWIRC